MAVHNVAQRGTAQHAVINVQYLYPMINWQEGKRGSMRSEEQQEEKSCSGRGDRAEDVRERAQSGDFEGK